MNNVLQIVRSVCLFTKIKNYNNWYAWETKFAENEQVVTNK